ncbi:MAG: hypothetical protein EZS28_053368, partial [Streblomastix strix]
MFESEFMKDIEQVHWWSDGGPHFRNKQLIWALLNEEDILIPGTNFEVNFTVPYHGKGAPDGIFGMYSTGLRNNMPKEGINSKKHCNENSNYQLNIRHQYIMIQKEITRYQ